MEEWIVIDFTNCEINKFRYYGGRNGGKICIVYNDEEYMLKFPALIEKSEEHEYTNSCISEYITSLKNQDCNNALKRIVPLIDMNKINKIIDETEYISDLRKEFYKRIINERYNKILKLAYERLEG